MPTEIVSEGLTPLTVLDFNVTLSPTTYYRFEQIDVPFTKVSYGGVVFTFVKLPINGDTMSQEEVFKIWTRARAIIPVKSDSARGLALYSAGKRYSYRLWRVF